MAGGMGKRGLVAAGLCAALAGGLGPSAAAYGQTLEARRIPDAKFVRIETIKFRPGGEDRAFALEDKYITPAWRSSGLARPLEIHTQTGPWDRIYVYALPGGLADLEWQVSRERAAFLHALARVAGSDARALEIVNEWDSLVERRETTVGHEHPGS
jgi:hypothetical protein